jgi:TatA/E family protein of Tat protein translocase
MFGLGMWEVLIILFIVLLLFGAKRLPEIGGSLGKGIREFKGSLTDVQEELKEIGAGDAQPTARQAEADSRRDEDPPLRDAAEEEPGEEAQGTERT